MSKFVIVKKCEDTDGAVYSDYVDVLCNTKEQAEQEVEKAIKEELECLGEGYERSEYDNYTIVNVYEVPITTYSIFEVDEIYNYGYSVQVENFTIGVMFFDYELSYEERAKVQERIEKIKSELIEKNCEYQTEEIVEELHKYYDFVMSPVNGSFQV